MPSAPMHAQEEPRLASLKELDLLPTRPSVEFDVFPQMAAKLLKTSAAAFTLVDRRLLWFKATSGISVADLADLSIPREESFCQYTILRPTEVLLITDTLLDSRFSKLPLVTQRGGVRTYAGMAVRDPSGLPIGAICVIDTMLREFTAAELEELKSIALGIEGVVSLHAARWDCARYSWLGRTPSLPVAMSKANTSSLPAIAERGLNSAGIILGIIANTQLGDRATFEYGNGSLAELLGTTAPAMNGLRLSDVTALITDPIVRSKLLEAMRTNVAARIDMPIRTKAGERWLGANVTFPEDDASGPRRMLLVGRDITTAMTSLSREQKSKLLMTAMFTQIGVPVALVNRAGRIAMANIAFRNLVAIEQDQVDGHLFDNIIAPPDLKRTQADAALQFQDSVVYRRQTQIISAGGLVADVMLTSAVLTFEGQQFRTVTLNPMGRGDSADSMTTAEFKRLGNQSVGEFRPLSLAAIRTAAGSRWERIALAVMLSAERIIRKRLGSNDVLTRLDDYTFAIWFNSSDKIRNDENLSTITHEVRLKLAIEFSSEIAVKER